MRIIIPAAGIGSRLQPHTLTKPKPLLPVAGKPMLAHVLDSLKPLNPIEIIFVVNHHAEILTDWIGAHCDIPARSVTQERLLGLGYAVKLALDIVPDEPVVIILSDSIIRCDLTQFVQAGRNVLGVKEVADPSRFGVVEISKNLVTGFEEKPERPKSDLAAVGLYYISDTSELRQQLERNLAAGRTTCEEIQLTDALQGMIVNGFPFAPFLVDGWYNCGDEESLLESNRELLALMEPPTPIAGSVIIAPAFIDSRARIEHSVIGPNVSVMESVVVRNSIIQNCILGQNALISDTVLRDSIIADSSRVTGDNPRLDLASYAVVDNDVYKQ